MWVFGELFDHGRRERQVMRTRPIRHGDSESSRGETEGGSSVVDRCFTSLYHVRHDAVTELHMIELEAEHGHD